MTYDDMVASRQEAQSEETIVQEKRDAQIIDSSVGTPSGNIDKAVNAVNSIREAYQLAIQDNNN